MQDSDICSLADQAFSFNFLFVVIKAQLRCKYELMYVYVWKKYLPVLRILLKRSSGADQVLSVDRFDFEKTNKAAKNSFSFLIDVVRGKLSPSGSPVAARDLIEVLMNDEMSSELIRKNHYIISLSSKFELHIRNGSPAIEMMLPDQKNISEIDIKSEGGEEESRVTGALT